MNVLLDLVFWILFTAVVFSGCYAIALGLGGVIIKVPPLAGTNVTILSLVLGSLMTPPALAGALRLLKQK